MFNHRLEKFEDEKFYSVIRVIFQILIYEERFFFEKYLGKKILPKIVKVMSEMDYCCWFGIPISESIWMVKIWVPNFTEIFLKVTYTVCGINYAA